MTPSQFAHFLVYSLISLYASRVVYLIVERIWIALRRWYELRQIWTAFDDDLDQGLIAEQNAVARLLWKGQFDRQLLTDAVYREMFPKRSAFVEPDPDYRPFMNDAAEYELERSA